MVSSLPATSTNLRVVLHRMAAQSPRQPLPIHTTRTSSSTQTQIFCSVDVFLVECQAAIPVLAALLGGHLLHFARYRVDFHCPTATHFGQKSCGEKKRLYRNPILMITHQNNGVGVLCFCCATQSYQFELCRISNGSERRVQALQANNDGDGGRQLQR